MTSVIPCRLVLCLVEQPVANLRPVSIQRLRLSDDEVGEVVHWVERRLVSPAVGRHRHQWQLVSMPAEQPLDLGSHLGLGAGAISPVHRQVRADGRHEFTREIRETGDGLEVLGPASERVIERHLLGCKTEILMTPRAVAHALRKVNEALDDLLPGDLALLVAGKDVGELLPNSRARIGLVRIRPLISRSSSFCRRRTWTLRWSGLTAIESRNSSDSTEKLETVVVGQAEHVDDLAGRQALAHELLDDLLRLRARLCARHGDLANL